MTKKPLKLKFKTLIFVNIVLKRHKSVSNGVKNDQSSNLGFWRPLVFYVRQEKKKAVGQEKAKKKERKKFLGEFQEEPLTVKRLGRAEHGWSHISLKWREIKITSKNILA